MRVLKIYFHLGLELLDTSSVVVLLWTILQWCGSKRTKQTHRYRCNGREGEFEAGGGGDWRKYPNYRQITEEISIISRLPGACVGRVGWTLCVGCCGRCVIWPWDDEPCCCGSLGPDCWGRWGFGLDGTVKGNDRNYNSEYRNAVLYEDQWYGTRKER